MTRAQNQPLSQLIYLLQNAHAGELAAYHAYEGHRLSLRDPQERQEIEKIRDEELEHRQCVAQILAQLGAGPRASRERLMKWVGLTIGLLCRIGGWLIPMYGAGKLESTNIVEYEDAARLAIEAGRPELVDQLLYMAEVEWDHELYFRQKYLSHRLHFLLPRWQLPPPRENIRSTLTDFVSARNG